ncbi:hypothetical protein PACTADRAFT_33870 [Pachysolen tannophilus NRRL Y-2460]|uniref:NADH-cytochrome b5 reductase n=1 Tax=Pachysolen tannophilus NRRL Y-2460 TaxID=669874 RepID=A0A1E4TU66_PACTA|nr:hypothetical protein PACTADRAFT_33870 [Pachysolen tannophilus NRRL Y-2460]
MFSKLSLNSRILISAAASSVAIGSAYYFSSSSSAIYNEPSKAFKGDDQWIDLKLKKTIQVSRDTRKLFFELPSPDDVSGLITTSCVLAKFVTPKGSNVIRPYTPISDIGEKGQIEFLIKRYPEGKMGNHIFELKENDTLSFKGPITKFKWEPNQFSDIGLIGGGTGITPLYQLLHHVTANPSDKTKIHLFYGNKTEDDILLKPEIDAIAQKFPDQVKVTYFLDTPPSGWKGQSGFITKDFLKENLPGPSDKVHVFVCGPPPLYKAISGNKTSPSDQGELTGALSELGYTKEQVFKY